MHVDIFSDGLVSCVPDMRRFVCNDDPIAFEMGLPPETASLMSSGSVQRQHHGSICSSVATRSLTISIPSFYYPRFYLLRRRISLLGLVKSYHYTTSHACREESRYIIRGLRGA